MIHLLISAHIYVVVGRFSKADAVPRIRLTSALWRVKSLLDECIGKLSVAFSLCHFYSCLRPDTPAVTVGCKKRKEKSCVAFGPASDSHLLHLVQECCYNNACQASRFAIRIYANS